MRVVRNTITAMVISLTALAHAQWAADGNVMKTPRGNTVRVPVGWPTSVSGSMVRFEAPEGNFSFAIVDIGKATDARTATQQAWAAFSPGDHHALKLMTKLPARRGWDERVSMEYESSAAENLMISATALRHGDEWTIELMDGSEATADKRYGATALLNRSLHPSGYVMESFANRTAHPLDVTRIEAMRSFVETAIKELEIPGASFALIDHNKVVYEGGVGVKNLGKSEPIDARTLFMIASNTKGMTTLLLAKLVDEGKLAWDEPVTKAYPAFRLGNATTTAATEIKNLVCACTGLPRKDMQWIFNTPRGAPASETLTQLMATQPTSKFGEIFQYNNQMASAAGYIAGQLIYPRMKLGEAYDRAMRDSIFQPLGMTDTTFSFAKALSGDVAGPHSETIDGKPTNDDLGLDYIIEPFRPAGGAWSSAHDLSKYVSLELSQGILPNGKRLVSAKNLLVRRVRGVSMGEGEWYGMGLEEDATWGVPVIHHGGNMPGYQSDLVIVPGANVGAVILTNADNGRMLLRPFRRRLLELLYDGKPEAAEDIAASAAEDQRATAEERKRLVFPADAAAVSGLAPAYSNPDLGPLRIEKHGASTRFVFSSASSRVASRKNDDGSTSIVLTDPGISGFAFTMGHQGKHRTLTIQEGQHTYVFTSDPGAFRSPPREPDTRGAVYRKNSS